MGEDSPIPNINGYRKDIVEALKELEKSKEISQDENKRAQDQLQQLTDGFIAVVEKTGQNKEEELKQV